MNECSAAVCSDVALRQTYGEAESTSNNLGRILTIVTLARASRDIRWSNWGISLSLKSHTIRQDIKTQCFGTNVHIYVPCGTYRNILRLHSCAYVRASPPSCCVHRLSENMLIHATGTRMSFVHLYYKGHRHRGPSTIQTPMPVL